jgi:nitric oxide reductase activation protein
VGTNEVFCKIVPCQAKTIVHRIMECRVSRDTREKIAQNERLRRVLQCDQIGKRKFRRSGGITPNPLGA